MLRECFYTLSSIAQPRNFWIREQLLVSPGGQLDKTHKFTYILCFILYHSDALKVVRKTLKFTASSLGRFELAYFLCQPILVPSTLWNVILIHSIHYMNEPQTCNQSDPNICEFLIGYCKSVILVGSPLCTR